MICLDKPYHMPLRLEHMAFFKPDYIAELRKKVDVKVTELLNAMQARGPKLDMVETFSAELPLYTLCEILGVPDADRPKLIRWMHYLELAAYTCNRRAWQYRSRRPDGIHWSGAGDV